MSVIFEITLPNIKFPSLTSPDVSLEIIKNEIDIKIKEIANLDVSFEYLVEKKGPNSYHLILNNFKMLHPLATSLFSYSFQIQRNLNAKILTSIEDLCVFDTNPGLGEEPHRILPIHMVWVGEQVRYISKEHPTLSLAMYLMQPILELDAYIQASLRSDIKGFLTFLEALILNPNDSIQLYFHCYYEYVETYEKIFKQFCKNSLKRNSKSIIPKFKVFPIESTVNYFFSQDQVLYQTLVRYLKFIKDPLVKNIRHRVNFRDAINVGVLYRFGGYTFDTNIMVSGDARFTNRLNEFLTIPLIPELECVILTDEGNEVFFNLSQNQFLINPNPGSRTYSIARTDIFALRAPANLPLLLNSLRFSMKNLIILLKGFESFLLKCENEEDRKNLTSWYFFCSTNTVLQAAILNKCVDSIKSNPSVQSIFIEPVSRPDELLFETQIKDGWYRVFTNLPIYKIFSNSHFIQEEYFRQEFLQNEHTAIKKYFAFNDVFNLKSIWALSPYSIAFESDGIYSKISHLLKH